MVQPNKTYLQSFVNVKFLRFSIKLDSVCNIQMHNNMDIYSIRYESIGL